jgi:hypothetical protein
MFNVFAYFLLIALILAFFVINSYVMESAYNHVNESVHTRVIFSDFKNNLIYKSIHFIFPVNIMNVFLWGDEYKLDAYIVSVLTIIYIFGSIFIIMKTSYTKLYYILLPFFVCLLVFLLTSSIDLTSLLFLNFCLYGLAIYCIYKGLLKKNVKVILIGSCFWLLPNIYQLIFLDGLYI